MGNINFNSTQSDKGKRKGRSAKSASYEVEYTDPSARKKPKSGTASVKQPRVRAPKISTVRKSKKLSINSPIAEVSPKSTEPDATVQSQVSGPAPTVNLASIQAVPTTSPSRQIPTPPPPPVRQASQPAKKPQQTTVEASVEPQPSKSADTPVRPVVKPVQKPAIPHPPSPPNTVQNASIQPQTTAAAPRQTVRNTVLEKPGQVHIQQVASVKGKRTQPSAMGALQLGVNLLPSLASQDTGPYMVMARLMMVVIAALLMIVVAFGGLLGVEAFYTAEAQVSQDAIDRVTQQLVSYQELRSDIDTTNARVQAMNSVLDDHIYWTNFFTLIEEYTLPNVTYTSFSGNTTGFITLQATTTDFTSVTRQIGVLNDQSDIFTSVNVSGASRSVSEATSAELPEDATSNANPVYFSISIQVNPEIFHYADN